MIAGGQVGLTLRTVVVGDQALNDKSAARPEVPCFAQVGEHAGRGERLRLVVSPTHETRMRTNVRTLLGC